MTTTFRYLAVSLLCLGAITAQALEEVTKIETLSQQLGYMMRAGAPDSLDRMVAISFGNLAVDQILRGHSGRMAALQEGKYTTVPADTPVQGTKRVDIDALYDPERYRPRVHALDGMPMFLY